MWWSSVQGAPELPARCLRQPPCVRCLPPPSPDTQLGGAAVPYLLGAELPNHAVREKTSAIGTSINVVWAFVTNFVVPYMLAALAFRVGFIFGGIAVLALVFTFFLLPETKGLVLEEIDDLFARPFNPFRPPPRPARLRRAGSNAAEQGLAGDAAVWDKPGAGDASPKPGISPASPAPPATPVSPAAPDVLPMVPLGPSRP